MKINVGQYHVFLRATLYVISHFTSVFYHYLFILSFYCRHGTHSTPNVKSKK